MRDRALGLLLFLPVPLVLFLFARAPLGVLPSLALGTLIMASHRLYARPFALARAGRRCLFCGGPAGEGPGLAVVEPFGATAWRACSEPHAHALGSALGWASAHAAFLKIGILGSLAVFLVLGTALAFGRLAPLVFEDASALFRLGVAVAVLPLGWLAWRRPPAAPPLRSPFPLHIQALIGTWAVLWLFRLIGLWWLAAGLVHLARRLGGA